jgi:choline kinase
VRLFENTAFRDGNLISLMTARPHLDARDELLLMNIDHIYRPAVAAIVAAARRTTSRRASTRTARWAPTT